MTVDVDVSSASVHALLLGIGGRGEHLIRELRADADWVRRLDLLCNELGVDGAASIASSSSMLQRRISGTVLVTYNVPQQHWFTLPYCC